MTEKKVHCPCGTDCKCDPCEYNTEKSGCCGKGKSCCTPGHHFWLGATVRIILIVVMIVGAYAWGVWNGLGERPYDTMGYGNMGHMMHTMTYPMDCTKVSNTITPHSMSDMHGKMSPTVGMFTEQVECMLGINENGYRTNISSDDAGTFVTLAKGGYEGKHTIMIQQTDGTKIENATGITLRVGEEMRFVDEKNGVQTYAIDRNPQLGTTTEKEQIATVTISPVGMTMEHTMSHDMMDMSMRDMTKMLEGKTGDELNKAFLEAMIPHHQGAVEMAKYLASSNKPELVKLGADIIAAQTKEIEQMQNWMKEWGYTK